MPVLLRLFTLVLWQASCACIGWYVAFDGSEWYFALAFALAGGFVWFVVDSVRGLRLVAWLRSGGASELSLRNGLWGEAYERVRRLLRSGKRLELESDRRLRDFLAALQASPNGVVLLDADTRIEWFNQTAAGHFGLDVRRDLQQHIVNLVRDPAFAAYLAVRNFMQDVAMPGRDSSSSKPVKLSVHLHPYGEGRMLLLSRDVTALEQAEVMRRDFVANVSHEIRTPLTVLAGFVETLQTLPLDEVERHRYLDLMAQQAQRMQTLVSDLLTLSRLEGSPLPSNLEWASIDVLFKQCEQDARNLSQLLWGTAHHFSFESSSGCALSGSASELYSAISNLISNAVRYTPVGKHIDVKFRLLPGGAATIAVTDQGVGIAQEHIPRLTERFYRVDRSRSRDTGGTGLGLAIVKHVAQRHGAELSIDSVPGKGSTFSLLFPANRVRAPHVVVSSA